MGALGRGVIGECGVRLGGSLTFSLWTLVASVLKLHDSVSNSFLRMSILKLSCVLTSVRRA